MKRRDRKSIRFKNWGYKWKALYYVTICTKNMKRFFGEVINGKMVLNEIGEIVQSEWLKTFEMRPDMNLTMGEYVVMPNHFHAIIGIGKNKYNTTWDYGMPNHGKRTDMDGRHCVPTSDKSNQGTSKNQFGPQSKNLGSIIRGFKIGVTKNARLINPDFDWHYRFNDRIIRDAQSYHRISKYIRDNPKNWKDDDFN